MERFIRHAQPNSLSVRDLLEARDHYHVHLANLPTVVGTAVGRYRIRLDDENFHDKDAESPRGGLGPRTLLNSDFRDWSWPCVLVFVSEWLTQDILARHPELTVPPVLYLPDGRQVRTCPILVRRRQHNLPPAGTALYGANKFGPNFQVFIDDQGSSRMGVASAIVEDGACAYALVSRHLVSGADAGSEVSSLPRGKRTVIGHVTSRNVDSVPLNDIYPGFDGRESDLTLDSALVKVNDVNTCTSQYLGVGFFGQPIDLSTDTMSLNLIGCPVFTELPGGNRVKGKVHGLFYRHTSVGGKDTLAEILIGPRDYSENVETRPGDSGAVWFWDADADAASLDNNTKTASELSSQTVDQELKALPYRPLCVQWGGHGFSSANSAEAMEFVLGTSLSSICKALSVDVVEDWSLNQSRYWGKVGHYKIGYAACFALQSKNAKSFFETNATSIAITDKDIVSGNLPSATQTTEFVALADVPDLVWRRTRPKDAANHFADMDEEGKGDFSGRTLLDLWEDKNFRTPAIWDKFYDSIDPKRTPAHRGALPFRVAQLFDVMVDALRNNNLEKEERLQRFLCAAGTLAHYIGDACQPLHVSYLHHGLPDDKSDDKVHSVYEDDMLDHARPELIAGINDRMTKEDKDKRKFLNDGAAAADAVVQLMKRTIEKLSPSEVLEVYNRVRGNSQSNDMWSELGDRTMDCMADGAVTLATVWQSAWTQGGGDNYALDDLLTSPLDTGALKALYDDKSFAESKWLHEM